MNWLCRPQVLTMSSDMTNEVPNVIRASGAALLSGGGSVSAASLGRGCNVQGTQSVMSAGTWRPLVCEQGVVHWEGDGNCGSGTVLGAGGNVAQLKHLAKPSRFADMENPTQPRWGRNMCKLYVSHKTGE